VRPPKRELCAVSGEQARGLTTREVARRYRASPATVLTWIRRGELVAVKRATALCGKPKWVILPDALQAFEQRRTSAPDPKPAMRRRPPWKDYFPDP
jgi:transposase